MSKFVEKLMRTIEAGTQPLGFGAAAKPRKQAMVLMASLPLAEPEKATLVGKGNADVILIPLSDLEKEAESLAQVAAALGEVPWGVSLEGVQSRDLPRLRELGCDFLVFAGEKTSPGVLLEEELGKVLRLDTSLPDALVRGLEAIPIDAVLVEGGVEEGGLTLRRLLVLQRLAALSGKLLLVTFPSTLQDKDLESLWEVGVRAVIVNLEGERPQERLEEARKALRDLVPPKRKPRERLEAVIPAMGEVGEEMEEEEEEEPV